MPWSISDLALAVTALIAFLALVRPDIERVFQRLRATIEMHPAGRLEVGFSNFGPTIGVQGTLQAIGSDEFISFSNVTVERVADNLRHEFQWAVFRPQSFSGTAQQTFEIASGFLLSVASPRRVNIQFHDSGTVDNFRQSLIELHRLWMDYLQAQAIVLANVPAGQMRATYNAFHQAHLAEITSLYSVIDRQFYWIQGAYRMKFELRTSRPAKRVTFNYTFALSDAESRSIQLNCIGCLLATCNVPDIIFNFAYPVYLRT
jgi:hypothetical protein